jgi:hypothetical protein
MKEMEGIGEEGKKTRIRNNGEFTKNHFCYPATCSQTCQNGGTCTGINMCTCVGGWSGSNCSTRIFAPFFLFSLILLPFLYLY